MSTFTITALALWSLIFRFHSCTGFTVTSSSWPSRVITLLHMKSLKIHHGHDFVESGLTRRNILHSILTTTSAISFSFLPPSVPPALAIERASQKDDNDVLSEFGQSIKTNFNPQDLYGTTSSWPNTPSPLPTMFKTAAELSSSTSTPPSVKIQSNLEQALEEASKKKRIDPRTHG